MARGRSQLRQWIPEESPKLHHFVIFYDYPFFFQELLHFFRGIEMMTTRQQTRTVHYSMRRDRFRRKMTGVHRPPHHPGRRPRSQRRPDGAIRGDAASGYLPRDVMHQFEKGVILPAGRFNSRELFAHGILRSRFTFPAGRSLIFLPGYCHIVDVLPVIVNAAALPRPDNHKGNDNIHCRNNTPSPEGKWPSGPSAPAHCSRNRYPQSMISYSWPFSTSITNWCKRTSISGNGSPGSAKQR